VIFIPGARLASQPLQPLQPASQRASQLHSLTARPPYHDLPPHGTPSMRCLMRRMVRWCISGGTIHAVRNLESPTVGLSMNYIDETNAAMAAHDLLSNPRGQRDREIGTHSTVQYGPSPYIGPSYGVTVMTPTVLCMYVQLYVWDTYMCHGLHTVHSALGRWHRWAANASQRLASGRPSFAAAYATRCGHRHRTGSCSRGSEAARHGEGCGTVGVQGRARAVCQPGQHAQG
jgi:hypothetical protein